MITRFKDYLAKTNLAKNTVASYVWTVNYFLSHYGEVNKKNLLTYKGYLVENFKPQTVNLRLQGINKYLEFTKHDRLKVKFVKVQQKNFLENVISDADYKFLKAQLKADGYEDWYFVVWFMAATGARVSELLHIKVEHVKLGYLDLYSKGGKVRRLYIPKNLRSEASLWLKRKGITSGYLFLNRFGQRITTRGIAQQLKHFADKYGLNRDVVYPHSFRHRFAKNFLDRFNDLALLADLMGHESIETTRIYLRRNWGGEYENVAVLVAIAVNEDGFREVLGAAEGMKEDKASWVSFFQWLRGRGWDGVKLIVGDKCMGMLEAVGEVFPDAKYQRCTVHFYRNVFSVVPKSKVKIVAKMLKAIHAQESKKASREKASAVVAELKAMKLNCLLYTSPSPRDCS